jgi:mannose-6-phosphate isomerase-like protein (cupin superfamily)
MQTRMTIIGRMTLGAVAFTLALSAQDPKPTCNQCPATYINNSELQAYAKRAMDNNLTDQQIRSVELGKSQLGVGVVYRGKLDQAPKNAVAEHDFISELYHVIEGSATLVTGPDLVDAKQRPSTMQTVREYNGPGKNAAGIRNGVTHQLKQGDVIVIPAGTGHLFTHIDDHILYLMVRIDPDKVVPLKDEAASKIYLASPVKRAGDN